MEFIFRPSLSIRKNTLITTLKIYLCTLGTMITITLKYISFASPQKSKVDNYTVAEYDLSKTRTKQLDYA